MARQERSLIPDYVLDAARKEYHVSLFPNAPALEPIWHNELVVGFYCPRERKIGRSIGPIFVHPDHRRQGIAYRVYASIGGTLVECVRNDNPPSIALMTKAGFQQWRRYSAGWWWRRE